MEDHKTYIPGIGFLVTSYDGSECRIIPEDRFALSDDEIANVVAHFAKPTEDEIAYDEAEAEAMAKNETRYFEEGK